MNISLIFWAASVLSLLLFIFQVPFGNNAFSKGKLVHTNEVMVLLGDNWFAEVSAKQATAIATRRIARK